MCECRGPKKTGVLCGCHSGRTPTFLRPAILAILSGGPSHGYGLMEKIVTQKLLPKRPDTGAVYRTLRTMEREGLIVSRWDTRKAGPGRRTYMINAQGTKALAVWGRNMRAAQQSLGALLRSCPKRSS